MSSFSFPELTAPWFRTPDLAPPLDFAPAPGLCIEALALPDESPAEWRALLDQCLADYPPATMGERLLVEQMAVAAIEKQRCLRARTALLAEQVRTAEFRFDRQQEQEVESFKAMLPDHPVAALFGLNHSAAGCRYLIGRWERLLNILEVEQSWYGVDRDEATLLQGAPAGADHLGASEPAFLTWLFCLLAQPNGKEADIKWMTDRSRTPRAFQDHDPDLWIPGEAYCRRLLRALVAHELAPLRAREEWLRTNVEQPARAAAREQARVLATGDLPLLRAERFHDLAFHRALGALLKRRPLRTARVGVLSSHAGRPPAPAQQQPRPVLLTGPIPGINAAAGAVFLDYHGAHRAVLEEQASGGEAAPGTVKSQFSS